MKKIIAGIMPMLFLLGTVSGTVFAKEIIEGKEISNLAEVLQLVQDLQEKTERMERRHAAELQELHNEIARLKGEKEGVVRDAVLSDEQDLYQTIKGKVMKPLQKSSLTRGLELDASVVVDAFTTMKTVMKGWHT